MKGYLNGTLQGEGFISYSLSTNRMPGDGNFQVSFNNHVDQRDSPEIIDRVVLYKGVLSAGNIAANCATVGLTVGAITVKPPIDTADSRLRNTPADLNAVPITPVLKTFIIDSQTIAVAGSFREWFLERQNIEFPNLYVNEKNYRNGYLQRYSYEFVNKYCLLDLYRSYQPLIVDAFDDSASFTVDGSPITVIGRWSTSIGLMRYPDLIDQTVAVENLVADIAQYAYIRLPTPMALGSTHSITCFGQTIPLVYDRNLPASSIKVNQEGYLPEAGRKYAYLGRWLGVSINNTAGKWNPTAAPGYNGTFEILPIGSNTSVFSGVATLRDTTDEVNRNDGNPPILVAGEIVYQLDFSNFNVEGSYQIYVPGIGYSYEFTIGRKAIAKCFWTTIRGLYHHRSGYEEIGPPYTNWVWHNAKGWTWVGTFVCDETQYSKRILTSDGSSYSSIFGAYFSLISHLPTGKLFREVRGGWYDAADFDNRPMHLITVRDIIEPYLRFPQNFTDGQLNLPTSGNGIPDILDEAEWGLNVFRLGQHDDGGVACEIEANLHEKDWPWTTVTKYYIGRANRQDTLEYAWCAAKLARAYLMVGTPLALSKAAVYTDSAIRAFNWGINPNNTLAYTFDQTKTNVNYTFTYSEDPDKINVRIVPAAAALFALTKDPRFASYITDDTFAVYYASQRDDLNNFARNISSEMLLDLLDYFPTQCENYRNLILGFSNDWVNRQNAHPYYMMSFLPTTEYWAYNFVSWGMCHPETRGRIFIYSWLMTNESSWRDHALITMDSAVGCNPLGRTQVTGLGKVPPIHNLDGWLARSEVEDNIWEPTPGISPYQFTAIDGYCSGYTGIVPLTYRLTADARTPEKFIGVNLNLLPGGFSNTVANDRAVVGNWLKFKAPLWRQSCELEEGYVPGGEYTIWETVGGKAFMWGCLMGGSYQPDPAWAAKVPATNRYDLDGLVFLP